ncbi:MAG TPA: hypothetical protein VFJ77_07645 [Gaiellaceae bacterium]|nr:hypothetical protein [Gaiellaceae bacterium]
MATRAAQAPAQPPDDPPIDPGFVELRYRWHRAQRRRRVVQREEDRLARYRFYVVLAVLVVLAAVFVAASLREVQHLFGI